MAKIKKIPTPGLNKRPAFPSKALKRGFSASPARQRYIDQQNSKSSFDESGRGSGKRPEDHLKSKTDFGPGQQSSFGKYRNLKTTGMGEREPSSAPAPHQPAEATRDRNMAPANASPPESNPAEIGKEASAGNEASLTLAAAAAALQPDKKDEAAMHRTASVAGLPQGERDPKEAKPEEAKAQDFESIYSERKRSENPMVKEILAFADRIEDKYAREMKDHLKDPAALATDPAVGKNVADGKGMQVKTAQLPLAEDRTGGMHHHVDRPVRQPSHAAPTV